jgi:hypothetical protein
MAGSTFEVREPTVPPAISEEFRCGQPGSQSIEIFRLLTGTANIALRADASVVKCRYDYIRLLPSRATTTDRKIARGLFGEDVSVDDAKRYVSQLSQLYRAFFQKLSIEIEHCIYRKSRGNPVEAFLHFYRALEKLAVAFPVLFITAQSDFERVHSMLKPLFSKDGSGGELAFVSNFCKHLAKKSDVLGEYQVSFTFDRTVPANHARVVSEIERVCPVFKDKITKEDTRFDLPYEHTANLLIDCRNKLFHNTNSGQKNFDIDRLGGAAVLCTGLVEAGLHWLALTYVEVIRNRVAQLGSWE